MKQLFRILLCAAAVLAAGSATIEAKVRLPRLVSDGMVLQRDTPLNIHGWADPGERVEVVFQDKKFSIRANRQGEWSVGLGSFPAGGPFTMRVGDVELSDVMVGEVWLCSGQSNMELPISRVEDLYADRIPDFNYPHIRYFRVPMHYAFEGPEADIAGGEWKTATPENLSDFSALAFFYGKELHELYGVPVGLINNAIGGSPIEAWVSGETIKKYPHYLAAAEECARPGFIDSMRRADARRGHERWLAIDEADPGVGVWNKAEFDDSDWGTVSLPGYWRTKGIDTKPGTVWFRREIELPAGVEEQEAILRMGVIVDADSTWVNGTYVGNVTYQYPPRIYRVPAGVLREGRNVIATRVTTNSGNGGFVEQKPYKLIVGAESAQIYQMVPADRLSPGVEAQVDKPSCAQIEIDLTGDWRYHIGAQPAPAPRGRSITFQYVPTGLYNGMLAPLKGFALRGFLWYQGESNVGRAAEYRDLMTDLIADWRRDWNNPEMPFIFAQLPGMMEGSGFHPENDQSGWAEFREAQRYTLRLPHTGMATTLDTGEWNDVHPLNKKTVAHRLALEARRVAYGESRVCGSGPLFENMTVENGSAILSFRCIGSDIDTNLRLGGFTIAGRDKKYVKASAVVLRGNIVRVWSDAVPDPVAVRYAWAGDPVGANLRDKDGIPASTFEAELFIDQDKGGIHDGYNWELWHQEGTVGMTLGEGGAFSCSWKDSHNVLFRTGKKFLPMLPLSEVGEISVEYGCDYRPDGNSYLCVYGWSVDPLIEFYIVESWGNWRPPGAKSKGTITVDGGTYDVYETTRVEMPSIQGTKTFKQYWSVRTDRKTEGTVSVSRHIAEWARRGMKLGDVYEVSLCVEGYESSGEADVYRHELIIDN